jgi:acyl-CoA thioester hydrolase
MMMIPHSPQITGTIEIRVRYNECDPMGVAHHTVYPVWFEMGRTELLRTSMRHMQQERERLTDSGDISRAAVPLTYRELEEQGFLLAVVKLEVQYKRPARYDDVVLLHTTLSQTSAVKIVHTYELVRDSEMLATGVTTLACVDRSGRAQALPAFLRLAESDGR